MNIIKALREPFLNLNNKKILYFYNLIKKEKVELEFHSFFISVFAVHNF